MQQYLLLCQNEQKFVFYIFNWREHNFKETGGTPNKIIQEHKQKIYNGSIVPPAAKNWLIPPIRKNTP